MKDQHLDRAVKEWRRFQALRLDGSGWLEVDIATALGVSKGTVSRWLSIAAADGPDALHSHPAAGGPLKLTTDQLASIPDFCGTERRRMGFVGTFGRVLASLR